MTSPPFCAAHLSALARSLGLSTLALDGDGLCSLAIDGEHSVHLQADPADGALVLFAEVATLPSAGDAQLLTLLLRANRFWRGTGGATLSLDEQSPPGLVLARRIDCAATTPAQFVQHFESFADHLVDWHARLTASPLQPDAPGLGGGMPFQFA